MTEDIADLKSQIAQLQSQSAFQEETVRSLDEALAAQQQEILLLRRQLELLKERQDDIASGSGDSADDPASEKPPHY